MKRNIKKDKSGYESDIDNDIYINIIEDDIYLIMHWEKILNNKEYI